MNKKNSLIKKNTVENGSTVKVDTGGISSQRYFLLRAIAVITMIIDYTAYLLYECIGLSEGAYITARTIGCVSFPLFCYQLVECFFFTENRKKHFLKILGLAVISEIPFNVFKEVTFLTLAVQNVCFELAIGFILLSVLNKRYNEFWITKHFKKHETQKFFSIIIKFDAWVGLAFFTTMFNIDFAWRGILLLSMLLKAKKAKRRKIAILIAFAIYGLSFFDLSYLVLVADLVIIYLAESHFNSKLMSKKFIIKTKKVIGKAVTNAFSRALFIVSYPVLLIVLIAIRLAFV